MKILKTEEIDQDKLNALFNKRGRKITIPLFTKRVVDVLEKSDKEFEVHQCRCGEVAIFRTDYADFLRQKLNTEDIPCNSCLGLDDIKISGQIFVRLSNILQLMEKRKIDKGRNRVYFVEDDFEQLKNEAKGLFATQTLDEFYYGFHNFINIFFNEFKIIDSRESCLLISEIVESALKINPNMIREFGDDVNDAIELDAATLNIHLVVKSRFDLLSKISDEKFLNFGISEFHEISTSYSKSEIKSKMTEYKDLVEVKSYLNLLLNLINVIEGRRIIPNPFKKLKLPPLKSGGRARKIVSIHDKIELFKYHSYGDRLYPLISDIFDLRLRNDESHNSYEINMDERIISSTRYDKETTFEDLDNKIKDLSSFYSFLSNERINKYHESLKPNWKNFGIEALTLGYEDPIMIDNRLFPNDNCMSELGIYQYWDFAYYENERRWIPLPNLSIDDGEFIISFENGNKFNYKLDYDVELWLDQLILHEAYNLCLYTISPLIPSFNVKSKIKLPLGGLFEVNILEMEEKMVKLPIKLTSDFSNKMSI